MGATTPSMPALFANIAIGAKCSLDFLYKTRSLFAAGNIRTDELCLATRLVDQACCLDTTLFVKIDNRNGRACKGQPQSNRPADMSPASGHNRNRTFWRRSLHYDFTNSQPPSCKGRNASLGGMDLMTL